MSRPTNAVLALLVFFQPLLALADPQQQTPTWQWTGPWQGGCGFGWIFPLLMFLMMGVCAVMFLRGLGSGRRWHCAPWHATDRQRHPDHAALEVLGERFANGEIPKQEYEEKRAAILSPGERNIER